MCIFSGYCFYPGISHLSQPDSGGDLVGTVGRLTLEDGCLRLQPTHYSGSSALIEWPYGYSYREVAGSVEVLDSAGQLKVSVGDTLELTASTSEESLPNIPCDGPVMRAWKVETPDSGMAEDQ